MARTLITDLNTKRGDTATIKGWVDVARQQGKMVFFDFRDRTGVVQGVVFGKPELLEIAREVKNEWIVVVTGIVNTRPEKNVKQGVQNGDIELEITALEVLSPPLALPFEKDADLNIETRLDHRPYTLRSIRDRDIFTVQASIVHAFKTSFAERGFIDFQAPALVGGDAEGGGEVFRIEDYFGKQAFLATSGQLYKQIMTGVFERVMTVAKTFRAEKSATTRHLSEITQLEFEMAFIDGPEDVMRELEGVIRDIITAVRARHSDVLMRIGTTFTMLPEGEFPRFTLHEAQEIIEREFGIKAVGELDMEPEHERLICEYTKRELNSDFVFITRFPTKKRAFYTMADPHNPEWSLSYDLLYRGLEILSGAQRIHLYEELQSKMQSRGMDPEKFSFYLQAFRAGMPPHGGGSIGLERITARMLGLQNVKEASAFPRDMNRIDNRLVSHDEHNHSE
jgi:nondiscriminating aspartyl-tRNA synthetase